MPDDDVLDPAAVMALTRIAASAWQTRAVQTAAEIGLADALRDGPHTVEELAAATSTQPEPLTMFLDALAAMVVVTRTGDGRYGPTAQSDALHIVDSVMLGVESYRAWLALPDVLRGDGLGFELANGSDFWSYLDAHPDKARRWNEWNRATGTSWLPAAVEVMRFDGAPVVVDVGGGEGTLLAEILRRAPAATGVLYDLDHAVRAAPRVLEAAGVASRCDIRVGDAFESVPESGSVYLLSRVLGNWPDREAVRLLGNVKAVMDDEAVLYDVVRFRPEPGNADWARFALNSLNQLLMWGSRTRTRAEHENLYEQAGLTIRAVTPTQAPDNPWWVIESTR
jgi:SAM-dependent methyltransferase